MNTYDRVKALSENKGFSIRALEEKMGFSYGSIAKWKNHSPAFDKLSRVASYLGVRPEALTGEDGYYENAETAQVAQIILDDPDLRALFDAAKDARPQDLQMAAEMLRRFKGNG